MTRDAKANGTTLAKEPSSTAYQYDAFISYSHDQRQSVITAALQQAIQRFAKPFWKRRAVRLFRDQTNLTANPDLWDTIVDALRASRFLILIASPRAAQSPWVADEVKWWLSYREAETIIIVLTAGSLLWNGNSFSESGTTALPSVARTAFRAVPLWLDLTAIAADTTASGWRRDGRFIDAVASISSRLRGIPKDDLFGEDLKRHRQSITTATVLLVTAIGAATVAAWQWRVAVQRADETEAALIWSRLDFEQSEDPRTNASVQSLWDLARASEGVRGAFLRHLAENRSHVGKLVAAPTLIMRAFGVHPHEQEIQRLLGPIFDAVRESYDSSQLQALAQAVHTLGAGLRRTQAGVGPVLDAIQRTPSPYQREALVKGLLTLIPDLPPELDFGHSGWEASSLSKAFQ